MRSGRHTKALEDSVEVVDDAGVVAIDVNRGVLRRHFQTQRRGFVEERVVGMGPPTRGHHGYGPKNGSSKYPPTNTTTPRLAGRG